MGDVLGQFNELVCPGQLNPKFKRQKLMHIKLTNSPSSQSSLLGKSTNSKMFLFDV